MIQPSSHTPGASFSGRQRYSSAAQNRKPTEWTSRSISPPTSSSETRRIYRDPDVDENSLCSGGIVYLKTADCCGEALDSWSSNRVGRFNPGPPIRALPVGHPVLILGFERDRLTGKMVVAIAGITSFAETSFDEYMDHRREYLTGIDMGVNIKFFNTLPFCGGGADVAKYKADVEFLYTTGQPMGKQCYLATESIHIVPVEFLRAYGVKYKNPWSLRLDEASYNLTMRVLGEQAQRYESLEELLLKKKARSEAQLKTTKAVTKWSERKKPLAVSQLPESPAAGSSTTELDSSSLKANTFQSNLKGAWRRSAPSIAVNPLATRQTALAHWPSLLCQRPRMQQQGSRRVSPPISSQTQS